MRLLLLDNYDSFTYNLYDYLLQCGAECQVLRNDALPLHAFESLDFQAIVLSPGPKRPADAGVMPALIKHWHPRVPILGVCLGHQAIGEFFGAKLVQAKLPMHGKTSLIQQQGNHFLFRNLPPEMEVMRYHSLILESLEGTPLDVIAQTASGEIMALAHRTLPLVGVQFHPESILTRHGLTMLRNWVQEVAKGGKFVPSMQQGSLTLPND
jgi:anthranilate synthase/aminodeoxychorismate synthase-like glutamine amidotransferase